MKKGIWTLLVTLLGFCSDSMATTLQVMVLYPQDVADEYQISTKIDSLIAYANQTYENSDVDIDLTLVHHGIVNLSGDGEVSEGLLSRVADPDNTTIRNLRNNHKPDLTVYLSYGSSSSCGIAYLPYLLKGRFGAPYLTGYMAIAPLRASSVVGVNCASYVFAHEIGHNLGARHSRAQGEAGTPYSYSVGWGVNSVFVTTMAYSSAFSNAPKVQYFSNPDIYECKNLQCGTSSSNAAGGIDRLAQEFVQHYSSCYPIVRRRGWGCHSVWPFRF